MEALVAFVVLSAAGLAAARLQLPLHVGTDAARQGAEAVRFAQRDLERWRAEAGLPTPASAPPGANGYDALVSGSALSAASASGGSADERLTRVVVEDAGAMLRRKTVTEQIDWLDRSGHPQRLALDTVIAGADPMLPGALWLARLAPPRLPLDGRAPGIPSTARRLGDGTSLLALGGAGTPVLRIDDRDGAIMATCLADIGSLIAPSRADLAACVSSHGLLVSGDVQFDGHAAGPPPKFSVLLTLTAGGDPAIPPVCATAIDGPGVGMDYRCVVYTTMDHGAWSGRSTLVPAGWTIGSAPEQRKVCRYSRDEDGSGAIDRNAEHPAEYSAVTESLTQQNFVVIHGDASCPVRSAAHAGDAEMLTVQHQP